MNVEIVPLSENHTRAIRDICFRTGFAGKTLDGIIDRRDFFIDLCLCGFFSESGSRIFVAEIDGAAAGYVFTAFDSLAYKNRQTSCYAARIVREIPKMLFYSKKDRIFYYQYMKSFLDGSFRFSLDHAAYPAVLHINVAPEYHSGGAGSLLLASAEKLLSDKNIPGIHLQTTSLNGKGLSFFMKHGYEELDSRETRFYDKWGHSGVKNIVLGKKL